jgi:hypothetical protein
MFLSRLSGLLAIALSLGLTVGAASAASAATVSYSTVLPVAASPNLIASGTTGVALLDENVFGTINNQRRSPWQALNSLVDPTLASSVYSAIRSPNLTLASAFFNFATDRSGLNFVWGTPGKQNRIELFLDGVLQFSLTGALAQNTTGGLSVLIDISDVRFDQLVFSADKRALEYANLAAVAAVPLPAGGLLLLGTLGGIAALRRRKAV